MGNRETNQGKDSLKQSPQAKQKERQSGDKSSVDSQSEFAVADKLRDQAAEDNKQS